MMRFQDQTFLVTGASSGIGRSTVIRLASEGARIVLVARDYSRLSEAREDILKETNSRSDHLIYSCDVSDEEAVIAMAKDLRKQGISLNGLVHCAGIHWLRPLQVTNSAVLQEMLTSHVVSSIAITRAIVTRRLATKEGCSIVWLSSAAALQGEAGTVAYAAAKGALISAVRALAVELARRNIRINAIAPGVVRTPQSESFLSNLSPEQVQAIVDDHLLGLGEPEDVAGVIAFLLSRDARWMTGTTIVVDGGLTAH